MKLAALPHAGPNLIEFKGIGATLSSQPGTGTPSAMTVCSLVCLGYSRCLQCRGRGRGSKVNLERNGMKKAK
ncbi:hypothetical protein C772_01138 [Bhargavaea cecembensis DSE10]|uniref:Uncharacterized protein n=1 Tax=Bhargavaea cecembensis DSE10 TaxID=1235279 RepID=M7NIB5_9BACL|nr:hypothetical protein C772_01138 [Bhargavaea cecembensis DSE10]